MTKLKHWSANKPTRIFYHKRPSPQLQNFFQLRSQPRSQGFWVYFFILAFRLFPKIDQKSSFFPLSFADPPHNRGFRWGRNPLSKVSVDTWKRRVLRIFRLLRLHSHCSADFSNERWNLCRGGGLFQLECPNKTIPDWIIKRLDHYSFVLDVFFHGGFLGKRTR